MRAVEPFGGTIGRTVADSTPHWPARPRPPAGAPNVVVILIDDLGFSHFGCFGSTIATPAIDSLAAGGLRYTNFHVTPLCSPTRAALLTGREPHRIGMRAIANFVTGFPNTRGFVTNHAATAAEMLREHGYATFALGKWHLCPMQDASAAGPFDQWPLARGFDRFYGFLDGETDQFHPELVHDNHHVDPPATPADGYHLSEDLVDHAVAFLHDSVSVRPDRPFFTYLAFGATHAPHQAPPEYLVRYRGRFDDGWDVARAEWFARQQQMGLLPPGTELAPRNPGVEAWDDLPEAHRRLAARLQEAFAGFLEHTDAQIGRFVAALADLGVLDDTLLLVLSDNGASQEGGPFGVMHEMKYFNFLPETPDEAVLRLDDIGGPDAHTNYPWGWAQAGNTPFRWYKQNTHEGGVHVPLVVHWPNGLDPAHAGGLRDQFAFVTDVVPTILDVVGVAAPAEHRGWAQLPVDGVSLRPTFAGPEVPSPRTGQVFEMMGHRAIISDGWKAVTRHQPGTSFDDDRWELYHLDHDRSECHDLAGAEPERLAGLVEQWWAQAEAGGILPLDDRTVELFGAHFGEDGPHRPERHYTYLPPVTPLPAQAGAALAGRSWDLVATVDRPAGAAGVLFASGTANSGLSLFVQGDRLVFDYNVFGDHHVVESDVPLPTGSCALGVRFRRLVDGGQVTLTVDGAPAGTMAVPFVMRVISSTGHSIGADHGSPVSIRYGDAFPFEGRLHRVDIDLVRPPTGDGRRAEDAEQAATAARTGLARQ